MHAADRSLKYEASSIPVAPCIAGVIEKVHLGHKQCLLIVLIPRVVHCFIFGTVIYFRVVGGIIMEM